MTTDDDLDLHADEAPQPVLAVVGRPNVGKSTLVNRILGRREAVVEDVPGVTRDRVTYDAQWRGRRFTVVDTGGWDPDAVGLQKSVAAQAEVAVAAADAVLFVVDATVGATDSDEAVVKVLRKAGKPVVLVANKVDDERAEADAAMLWSLGLGEPYTVSACTAGGAATCSTSSSTRCPRRRPSASTSRAARAASRWSGARTSASPRCSTGCRGRSASSSTASPAPPATRSTAWSRSAARPGASSTPPACAAGGARLRREYYSSLRTQAPSTPPRSRSCCSTPASRSASRTSA
jgi:small GTP-binding protein